MRNGVNTEESSANMRWFVFQEMLASTACRIRTLSKLPKVLKVDRKEDTVARWRAGTKRPDDDLMRRMIVSYWENVLLSVPSLPGDSIVYQRDLMLARFDNELEAFIAAHYHSFESNYSRAIADGDIGRMIGWGLGLSRCMMTKYAMAVPAQKPFDLADKALAILTGIYRQEDRDEWLGDLMPQFRVTFAMAKYNVVEFELDDPIKRRKLARDFIELEIHTMIDALIERVPANEVLLHDSMIVGAVLIHEPERDFAAWVRGKFQMLQRLCSQYKDPRFSRLPLRPLAEDEIVMLERQAIYGSARGSEGG
jgi:hypothetical protein